MPENIEEIIKTLDNQIVRLGRDYLTPPEANKILEEMGVLNDNKDRPGSPLRKILRENKIPHAYQVGDKWRIPLSYNEEKVDKVIESKEKEIVEQAKSKEGVAKDKWTIQGIVILCIILLVFGYAMNSIFFTKEKPYEYKPLDIEEIKQNKREQDSIKLGEVKEKERIDKEEQLEKEKELSEQEGEISKYAFIAAKQFMEDNLKAPASAKFPWGNYKAFRIGNDRYIITSYVDAQNSYGALLRTYYKATLKLNGDYELPDSWELENLETDENSFGN